MPTFSMHISSKVYRLNQKHLKFPVSSSKNLYETEKKFKSTEQFTKASSSYLCYQYFN
jgi:hypothetical protein